jgi:hypothetical protein
VLVLCGLLSALTAAPAAAEWQFAPFVGFSFKATTNFVYDPTVTDAVGKRHWNLGGTARLVGPGPVGIEALFLYVPGFFESDDASPFIPDGQSGTTITESRLMSLMGNVVLTTPRNWNQYGLRPYVSGGVGVLHVYHNETEFPVSGNLLGYNVGGGAVGLLTDRVGLRFDVRYFQHVPPGKESSPDSPDLPVFDDRVRIHFWSGTIGVVFKF